MRNFWLRIMSVLVTLYEMSCLFVAPFVFFYLVAHSGISLFVLTVGLFIYELPMCIHLGMFGEKAKQTVDNLMKW